MPTLSENITQVISDFDSIKTAIENTGVEVGNVPTSEYSEYVTKVYDKGVADGKQAENNVYWSCVNSNVSHSSPAGIYTPFTDETFRPNGDVFCGWESFYYSKITNLKAILEERGLNLCCYTGYNTFYGSKITHLPKIYRAEYNNGKYELDDSDYGYPLSYYTFYNCKDLISIDEVINMTGSDFSNCFSGCSSLTYVRFRNIINKNANFKYSPLSVDTAKHIISKLKNFKGTSSEFTYKLTLNGTVWTALNEAETPPIGETWQLYVNSLGWNCA